MTRSHNLPPMPEMSDEALVDLAEQGNHEAFDELLERNRGRCIRVAFKILRNFEDAQEEVQNSFCKAYTHLGTFNHEAQFGSWLIRIVINHCYMRLRRAKHVRFVSFEMTDRDGESYQYFEPEDLRTPERSLGITQLYKLVHDELKKVPPLLRTPLELHVLEELPIQEVARRLETSVTAVKSRLTRGRVCLRDRMRRHMEHRHAKWV